MIKGMFDSNDMNALKEVDIRTVERKDLIDLNSVIINTERSVHERIEDFIQQIKNPYCFKVGEVAVKVVYKENGPTFQESFEEMLMTM